MYGTFEVDTLLHSHIENTVASNYTLSLKIQATRRVCGFFIRCFIHMMRPDSGRPLISQHQLLSVGGQQISDLSPRPPCD